METMLASRRRKRVGKVSSRRFHRYNGPTSVYRHMHDRMLQHRIIQWTNDPGG